MLSLNKQARVWCGISKANSLNAHTSQVVLAANENRIFLEPLLNWKDKRTNIDPTICDQIPPILLNKPC
ncbi:hypothetical protein Ciccas_000465 [Cichlidogyrus casuarinus]|uniref:Uncharacterized protein n=1 Tax=Cichlidogyrus casuarinus TaxID=1844966 RepID=A0ABD2QMU0_9PLAT